MAIETLSQWLEAEGITPAEGAGRIADPDHVRGLLIAAARERRAVSYSELLQALGHRFSRPKMRALCKTLDAVDTAAEAAGEPALAVLVVRESDRLPGQGWWIAAAANLAYEGPWTGPAAASFVRLLQEAVFDYWRARQDSNLRPRA
jgi:hypothetical protein